ncbi:uncharacterized protein TNCV_652491 [Trichonephila clavipes]|nr:uncharacterized protein TNCV_652491 [Trichonephila clavipes]
MTWNLGNFLNYDLLPRGKRAMSGHGVLCGLMKPISILQEKVIVRVGTAVALVIGIFFFEEISPAGPVNYIVADEGYKTLFRNHVLSALHLHQHMQDGALMHIGTPMKQLLNTYFGDDRIKSHYFPTAWS